MFKTAKIAEKTIYKEFRVHNDFDSHQKFALYKCILLLLLLLYLKS